MSSILTPGTTLKSRYKIDRTIYEAPLVNIYYSKDLHMAGKFWAVREMQTVAADALERNSIVNKFLKEASLLSQLSHPSYAKVVDFFADGNYLYLVREFIPGTDLLSLLELQKAPFTEEQVISWGIQLCDLFQYLYLKKLPPIFFREFNMGNIVVSQKSEIKITDMGLAKIFYADTGLGNLAHLGASEYAAPEQYSEAPFFDVRSLVYSIGAFMYHALSNVNPSSNPYELQSVNLFNPSLSRHIQDVIKRATEPDPKRRFQNILELRKSLASKSKNATTKLSPAGAPRPIKAAYTESPGINNNVFIVVTVVLLFVICILGYYFFLK